MALAAFCVLPILIIMTWLGTWIRMGRIPLRFWGFAALAVGACLPVALLVNAIYQRTRSGPPATVLEGLDSPAFPIFINAATGLIAVTFLLLATASAELICAQVKR